jgi:hypothetical protein
MIQQPKKNLNDPTEPTPAGPIKIDTTSYSCGRIYLLPTLPANTFKKNDTVKFKHGKKVLSGKIVKIGESGVDVNCNGFYYYCSKYDEKTKVFQKSNKTKNYR